MTNVNPGSAAAEEAVPAATSSVATGAHAGVGAGPVVSRLILGVSIPAILGGLLLVIACLWAAWTTRELMALKQRHIVSVSLGALVHNFVASEARSGVSQDQAAVRTTTYIRAAQAAVESLRDQGNIVLVSEAVVGGSVPDMTAAVSAAVDARMKALGPTSSAAAATLPGQVP